MSDRDMTWIKGLVGENLLAILDILLDIEKELQFGPSVEIPILQMRVRFRQLFPVDSPGSRDRYSEIRWKAANLLKSKGILTTLEIQRNLHRWQNRVSLSVDQEMFTAALAQVREEYALREQGDSEKPEKQGNSPESSKQVLLRLCSRFHAVVLQLRHRHDHRPTLAVNDEYDVQDLLHALLRLQFDDVRPEEWTPSYAGKSSRVDFLLKKEGILVETKKTRDNLASREISDQLIIDIARYAKHPDCKMLVCMVYDPEHRIVNPQGFQSDLSGTHNSLPVEVVVVPSQ